MLEKIISSPITWTIIGLLAVIAFIILDRPIESKKPEKKYFQKPGLTEEDISFVNKQYEKHPDNEARLNSLLTKEDKIFIDEYYESSDSLIKPTNDV